LWCITRPDLFAPALAQAGLKSDRVIYLEAGDDKSVLACFEEGLRHGGLGAVVAEVARLPMTASRRLHLAAEGSGTIGMALRRWRRQTETSDFGQPTAAVTRWRSRSEPRASTSIALRKRSRSSGLTRTFTHIASIRSPLLTRWCLTRPLALRQEP
jgi:hypothetical protein